MWAGGGKFNNKALSELAATIGFGAGAPGSWTFKAAVSARIAQSLNVYPTAIDVHRAVPRSPAMPRAASAGGPSSFRLSAARAPSNKPRAKENKPRAKENKPRAKENKPRAKENAGAARPDEEGRQGG